MITKEEARANVIRVRKEKEERKKAEKEQLRKDALKEVEKICESINEASLEGFTAMEIDKTSAAKLNQEIYRILREELGFTVFEYVTEKYFRVDWWQ